MAKASRIYVDDEFRKWLKRKAIDNDVSMFKMTTKIAKEDESNNKKKKEADFYRF